MKLGKKLLSLLTVLCLTLSLFPTMALADGNVSVGGTGTSATSVSVAGKTLNENTPYLVKNENTYNNSQSQVEGATYATFDAKTGTLTLNNYNYTGTSGISSTGGLTINLVGINTITTSGANSIYSTGALTITSSSKGSLTAENLTSGSVQTTIYSTSDITITGNATVTATINGTAQAINSNSANGTITIADHATVTAVNEYSDSTTTGTDSIAILAGSGNDKAHPTGTIEVKGSATLTAQGYGKALACQTFSATGTVKASTDYQPETPVGYDAANLAIYKYITATPAVVNYDVWVGGTQVTSANKDNVLNDANATVKYTPADGETAQKLTLNGMSITNTSQIGITASNDLTIALTGKNNTISGTGHAIKMTNGALTIIGPGSLEASSDSGQTTVYTKGNVTINGGAKITATNTSDGNGDVFDLGNSENKHTLTITGTGTQVIAQKTVGSAVAINHISTLTVNGDATLTAQSNGTAISCDTFTRGVGYTVNVDATNYDGSGATASYQDSSRTTYKYVKAEPGNTTPTPVISYGVWIGSTELTSANTTSISGVSYEPTTQTLTLNGAHITGAPNRQYTSTIKDACGIYAKHDLTIELSGTNTVSGSTETQDNGNYGIFVSGRLTFTSDSDGSLTVSGGTSSNNGNAWVPGVYASGITVNNCNVTAIGGTASDSYPVAYAMSKAPTLVGAKVAKVNTATSEPDTTVETYDPSHISRYKYLEIKQDTTDTSVAAPVITPEGGYFTGSQNVTISCPMNDVTIRYTTDGTDPNVNTGMEYTASSTITLNTTGKTTIKAIAVKGNNKKSDVVTAEFTQRAAGEEVTKVALDVAVDTHNMTTKVGNTEKLTATVQYKKETTSGVTVTWLSDNPDVATVAQDGTITAKSVGKARVTAAVVENGVTYSDFCDVIVEARPSSSHHSSSSTTYYDVNAAVSGEGGSVAAGTKRASRGTTVTVTATAASGYQVAQVSAVDKDGKTVSLTDKGDGVYTFVMPASKVDVTARFAQVQKPEEKDPYGDVSKDSYYYDAVKWAAETGVTTGVGDGLFAPEWVCTRGQIVTFLWRASGSPAPKATELPFTDVAADAYYAQAVLWAVENGITNGTSETTFSPDQTCTRAHAVAFLYRMSGSPAAAGSTFSDVAADAYYSTAVAWAVEKGITNGTSGTTFSPDDTCTRGQIVTFLYRLAQTK